MSKIQKINQILQLVVYIVILGGAFLIGTSSISSLLFGRGRSGPVNTIELKPEAEKPKEKFVTYVSKPVETSDKDYLVSYIVNYLSSDKKERLFKSLSYSKSTPYTHFIGSMYWGCFNCTISNLRVYDRETSNYKDMFDKSVLLNGFMIPKNKDKDDKPVKNKLKNIFYTKVDSDFNEDSKLDKKDGYRLFTSNLKGSKHKAISPKGTDFVDIKIDYKFKKLYIQVKEDSNSDKVFDDKDNTVVIVKNF